jgi:hypothetical protein
MAAMTSSTASAEAMPSADCQHAAGKLDNYANCDVDQSFSEHALLAAMPVS